MLLSPPQALGTSHGWLTVVLVVWNCFLAPLLGETEAGRGGVSCPASIASHPQGRHSNLLQGTAAYLLARLRVRV